MSCNSPMVATATNTFEPGSIVKTRFQNGVWYRGVFKKFAHKGKKRKEEWMLIQYADGDVYVINPHKLETIQIPTDATNLNCPYALLPECNPSLSLERADVHVTYDSNLTHEEIVRILS